MRLDNGSEWASNILPSILIREGRIEEARTAARGMSQDPIWHGKLLQACLENPTGIRKVAQQDWAALDRQRDPEMKYWQASILAFCDQKQMALQLLRSAIANNYCAVSALKSDPLWVKIRNSPEFVEVQSEAAECQKNFLAERKSGSGSP